MAHQIADGEYKFIELGDDVHRKRQALLYLLGVVANTWSGVEFGMTCLYATLMGKYLPHNQKKGPPQHPIAFQIFDSLESTHKRLQLIDRLVDTLVTRKTLIKEYKKKLLPLVKNAAEKRNTLLHSYWGANDHYPDGLIRVTAEQPMLLYKASDFHEAINVIKSADDAVTKFEAKVGKHLKWKKRPT